MNINNNQVTYFQIFIGNESYIIIEENKIEFRKLKTIGI